MISKKRPSPSIDGDDDESIPRARKRRSPLPLFDSDSTPECTESSSDESNGPISSQSHLDIPGTEQPLQPKKLTIKLRGLRTTDPIDPPVTSLPAPTPLTAVPPPSITTTTPSPAQAAPPASAVALDTSTSTIMTSMTP